jgi:hypothetical protein
VFHVLPHAGNGGSIPPDDFLIPSPADPLPAAGVECVEARRANALGDFFELGLIPTKAAIIYFKSILTGLVSFVLTIVLYGVAIILYIQFYVLPRMPPPPGHTVAFDLSRMGIPLWPALMLAILGFAAGFYLMFRRSSVSR